MLPDEQGHDRGQREPVDPAKLRDSEGQRGEEEDRGHVEPLRQPQRPRHAEPRGDALEAVGGVEGGVLAGVDDVEARDPEHHRQAEDGRGQHVGRVVGERLPAKGDPRGHGGEAEGRAKPEMREGREPLGITVAQQPGEHRHGEHQRQPVGQKEERGGDERGR